MNWRQTQAYAQWDIHLRPLLEDDEFQHELIAALDDIEREEAIHALKSFVSKLEEQK